MHDLIRAEISSVVPFDDLEQVHVKDALAWVDSGSELFRVAKPATPPKHLVSYFAVVDAEHILLVDHKDAGLWLPSGGHVEPGEHPRATVERELQEELGFASEHSIDAPLMVTCTTTVGVSAGHTDVSLWYVVQRDSGRSLKIDQNEFESARWFRFAEIPVGRCDPNLGRFVAKLRSSKVKEPCPA